MKRWNVFAALVPVVGLVLGGTCTPSPSNPETVILTINTAGQGGLPVVAGTTFTRTTIFNPAITRGLSSGVVTFAPEQFTVESNDPAPPETRTFQARVYLSDAAESQDEACGGAISDGYGPFTVTIDANDNVIDVTPSTVDVVSRTLELLSSDKELRLCLEASSDFDVTVTFNQVKLELTYE